MVSHDVITVGKEEFIKAWFAVIIRLEEKGVLCLNTRKHALPFFLSPLRRQFGIDIGAVNNLRLCFRGPSQARVLPQWDCFSGQRLGLGHGWGWACPDGRH